MLLPALFCWVFFPGTTSPSSWLSFPWPSTLVFRVLFPGPSLSELIPCEEEPYSWLLKVKQETFWFSSTPGHMGCITFELIYIHSFALLSVLSQGCGWCSSWDCMWVGHPTQRTHVQMSLDHWTHFCQKRVIIGQEKWGKAFQWRTRPCLVYPSRFYDSIRSVVFMVFKLFFGFIRFRKLASMQMIPTHRQSSELCPVEVKLIQPCVRVISQFCIYYTNSSQPPWLPIHVSAL